LARNARDGGCGLETSGVREKPPPWPPREECTRLLFACYCGGCMHQKPSRIPVTGSARCWRSFTMHVVGSVLALRLACEHAHPCQFRKGWAVAFPGDVSNIARKRRISYTALDRVADGPAGPEAHADPGGWLLLWPCRLGPARSTQEPSHVQELERPPRRRGT
jgi:hypothetical protein